MGRKGYGGILVMAGIRRDIFVWDVNKEEILRWVVNNNPYLMLTALQIHTTTLSMLNFVLYLFQVILRPLCKNFANEVTQ